MLTRVDSTGWHKETKAAFGTTGDRIMLLPTAAPVSWTPRASRATRWSAGGPSKHLLIDAVNTRTLIKAALAILMLAGAALFFIRFLREDTGVSEKAFFYDLSEQRLFTAPRTAVPPIKGIKGAQEAAVRAVVISTTGDPKDKSSWKVAYLEKYSPELKKQMETAQANGNSPQMGRTEAQAHRFVKRMADSQWFPMDSPQGEAIVNDWATPGPNGVTPVVCAP